MKRGEIWTVAGAPDYSAKPRRVVICRDDRFDATLSVTVCGLTTDSFDAPWFRLPVAPTELNGLRVLSMLMADKVSTVPRSKLGSLIGRLDADDLIRLNRSIIVFLNLLETR
jgi:mRNA interferase MazF